MVSPPARFLRGITLFAVLVGGAAADATCAYRVGGQCTFQLSLNFDSERVVSLPELVVPDTSTVYDMLGLLVTQTQQILTVQTQLAADAAHDPTRGFLPTQRLRPPPAQAFLSAMQSCSGVVSSADVCAFDAAAFDLEGCGEVATAALDTATGFVWDTEIEYDLQASCADVCMAQNAASLSGLTSSTTLNLDLMLDCPALPDAMPATPACKPPILVAVCSLSLQRLNLHVLLLVCCSPRDDPATAYGDLFLRAERRHGLCVRQQPLPCHRRRADGRLVQAAAGLAPRERDEGRGPRAVARAHGPLRRRPRGAALAAGAPGGRPRLHAARAEPVRRLHRSVLRRSSCRRR